MQMKKPGDEVKKNVGRGDRRPDFKLKAIKKGKDEPVVGTEEAVIPGIIPQAPDIIE